MGRAAAENQKEEGETGIKETRRENKGEEKRGREERWGK